MGKGACAAWVSWAISETPADKETRDKGLGSPLGRHAWHGRVEGLGETREGVGVDLIRSYVRSTAFQTPAMALFALGLLCPRRTGPPPSYSHEH